jgi:hypothetical protein
VELTTGRNPKECGHPNVIRRGKVLFCLDCDRVLPSMPDWLLLKNHQEAKIDGVPETRPKPKPKFKPKIREKKAK